MEYKESYFDSGRNYKKNKGLYALKERITSQRLKGFFSKKSDEHFRLKLLDRWRYLKGCTSILDIGCGKCEFIKLNPYHARVSGTDINENEVKKAISEGLDVRKGDINSKLFFKNESFDAVSCFHVLEHVVEYEKAGKEFRRVLKKDGILFIIVPNYSFKSFYGDYTHKKPWPKLALFRFLSDYGFYNIQVKNGPLLDSQIVNAVFLFFPKLRLFIEKFLGKFFPSEIIAIARKK